MEGGACRYAGGRRKRRVESNALMFSSLFFMFYYFEAMVESIMCFGVWVSGFRNGGVDTFFKDFIILPIMKL